MCLKSAGNFLLFKKDNSNDLANKMIELCTDTEVTKMCEASEMITEYDVLVAKDNLLNIFNKLVLKNKA